MATYNYKEGKKRVKEILNSKLQIEEPKLLPSDDSFTFSNGYKSWVSSVFIDIRKSTELFQEEDKVKVAKIIRSFTSEIIEILRLDSGSKEDEKIREIGIRGDCVYAIYATPHTSDIFEIADKTFYINTYMEMLNKLLDEKGYPNLNVGIGMGTAEELVVKAGRKDVGINSKVWIGEAVTTASNLSGLGNKVVPNSLVYSKCSYDNFIEQLEKLNGEARTWFHKKDSSDYGCYYHADIIKKEFRQWISDGMPD